MQQALCEDRNIIMGNCSKPTSEVHQQIELYDALNTDYQQSEPQKAQDYSLSIQARISKKDSAGIYDYVADKYEESTFRVTSSSGTLASDKNDKLVVTAMRKVIPPGSEHKGLLNFNKLRNGSYLIKPEHSVTSELGLWMITRREEQKYQLKQHDVIKLGRTLLRVKTLYPAFENDKQLANLKVKERQFNENVELLSNQGEMEAEVDVGTMKETEQAPGNGENVCRICYCGLATPNNPLVSLCKCTGSMRYTHYNCIKNWMDSKLYEKKSEVYTFVSFKNLKCEICKVDFPYSIEHKHKTYQLVDVEAPSDHYITLEMYAKEKDCSEYLLKGLYVIKMDLDREVTIGRGRHSNIIVNDISVSRTHCKISMIGEKFFLEDHGSKFGTLVSICQGFVINPEQVLELQINQVFLKVSYLKSSSDGWMCCGSSPVNEAEILYQEQDQMNYVDTQEIRPDNEN